MKYCIFGTKYQRSLIYLVTFYKFKVYLRDYGKNILETASYRDE